MKGFNLSAWAVKEGSITLFLILAVAGAGILAFLKLGRAEDPAFTLKVLTVTAIWPGATAQEMQDLVADPLEKRMQELRWYDRVETFTRPGEAFLLLTLKDTMPPSEVSGQFYQTRKKLEDAAPFLPAGVEGPFVNDEYSDISFALYALKAEGLPPRLLVRQAEDVRQQLLQLPGVKKVDILGEQPEKIFVEFSNARLANLGINPRDVIQSLQKQNTVTAAGLIDTQGPQVILRVDGAYDDLQKIRDTPIRAGSRVFKLSDVAKVKRGYEDPPTFLIRNDGEPALILSIVMQEGWNGLVLGQALEAKAEELHRTLPLGLTFDRVSDQAVNINEAVNEFTIKFFVALLVVMLVSFISLGWRVGIVVASAVPLTLAAVFVIMMITGRAFDRITLGALIISLGLLVDDAIIAIEIMVVKVQEGLSRVNAAAYAWTHTAAPMLAGTLVTVIGFTPIGFAKSSAGEYAGNIFWIVGFALLASWVVAVVFTPYLGANLLPAQSKNHSGHESIYDSPNYRRLRLLVTWAVLHKRLVVGMVFGLFLLAAAGAGLLKQQFFPTSDRPELLVEIQEQEGTSIETTTALTTRLENWLMKQPEAKIVTSYIGGGPPRFFASNNPELPDPSFAKIVVLTPNAQTRESLKLRLRAQIAAGLAPEARIRVTQLFFGPPSPFPVAFRVMGPDANQLRRIADQVEEIMRSNPHMRQVNRDWTERQPTVHFVFEQDRLRLLGLDPSDAAQQLQFLLTGVSVTQVREDIRAVDVVARSSGQDRLDPTKLSNMTLTSQDGHLIPLSQIGSMKIRAEDPILHRRNRVPTITVQGDIDESLQPPQVSQEIQQSLKPLIASLPDGYRIETGGNIEESDKATAALLPIFPIMIALTLMVIIFQVRSFSAMTMVFLTGPLGLVGVAPALLLFHQPFGFNAILGLIGLSGIIMRNTLILLGQIKTNESEGLDPFNAVVEATVQRARPVLLTAAAAVLAFIPLTQSVFWGSMAYALIGGTAVGTVLILFFLPTLYATWFGVACTDQAKWSERHLDLVPTAKNGYTQLTSNFHRN